MFNVNSRTFSEIYESYDDFANDLNSFGYDFSRFKEQDLKLTFALLVTRYGDCEISSYENVSRCKMRLQYVIFTYGHAWAIKREIQNQILDIKEEDLQRSSVQISNVAENPATIPDTNTITELEYINKQVTNATKRDKLSILILKYGSLTSVANEKYINKFKDLFSRFPMGDKPIYYYRNEKIGG